MYFNLDIIIGMAFSHCIILDEPGAIRLECVAGAMRISVGLGIPRSFDGTCKGRT